MKTPKEIVYVGLDVAKASLQLCLNGKQHSFTNDKAGHEELCQSLKMIERVHVVCEATGGYDRAITAKLRASRIRVSVVNPARVRHFGNAQGRLAKSDPIDATLLSEYGTTLHPPVTP